VSRSLVASINGYLIDKVAPINKRHFRDGWKAIPLNVDTLIECIQAGMAFSYIYEDEVRTTDNFIGTDFLCVDIDEGWNLEEAKENEYIKKYCSFLYTTASHTVEKPKFRLVFILKNAITDVSDVKFATKGLATKFAGDDRITDGARMFYGSSNCYVYKFDQELPEKELKNLIENGKIEFVSDSAARNPIAPSRAREKLPKNTIFKTASGKSIKAENVSKKTTIYCPFHIDKTPSAFISKNHKGSAYVFCSTCNFSRFVDDFPALDFDDFENTVKKYKQSCKSKNFDQRNFIEENLGEDIELNVSGVSISNKQFLSLTRINPGLTFIKSPKGSGKTTFLKNAVRKIIFKDDFLSLEDYEEKVDAESEESFYTNKRVLLIGHRQALIREMCNNLGLSCYLDMNKHSTSKKMRFGVCLDSLYLALDKKLVREPIGGGSNFTDVTPSYDLVIIDESEQVLNHFISETLGNKKIPIFNTFQNILVKAKAVICLDADLGWLTFKTITSLQKNKNNQIKIYINNWVGKSKPLYIYSAANQLTHQLKQSILQGKKIYVSSNSKNRIQALEKSIQNLELEMKKAIKYIAVTSANSKNKEIQNFITNIKSEIKKYQVVLSSPSLGTGIDISFESDLDEIDVVYGFYENRVNTHTEIDQQLSRVRKPKEVHIWISPVIFNFETEFEVVKEDFLKNDFVAKTYLQSSPLNKPEDTNYFLEMASQIVSYQRASKNNLKVNFLNYKTKQGWSIVKVDKDEAETESGKKFYKTGKDKLEEEDITNIVNSKIINQQQYDNIKFRLSDNSYIVQKEDFFSFIKTRIELFYGEDATRDLVKLDNKGKLQKALFNYFNITDKSLIQNLDSAADSLISSKQNKVLKTGLISQYLIWRLISKTPVFKNFKFNHLKYFTMEDLKEFTKEAIKLKTLVDAQLEINTRKDVDKKPIQHLWQLLKLVGIGPWKRMTKYVNGQKIYIYRISMDDLDFAKTIKLRHKDGLCGWAYINKKYGF
jgi:hypothetical protein